MTGLRDLRPPEPVEDEDDTTWDSTFQREIYRQAPPGSATISSHAMAVGSHIYGLRGAQGGGSIHDDSTWTWQQSLTGEGVVGLVNMLTSNSNGTVIAAATDAGVVTLMRGSDGQVLATRKVGSDISGASLINLTWIPSHQGDDVLLIEEPNSDENDGASKLTLVSNIQGEILNLPNSSVVAEAAPKMQIQTISFAESGYSHAADLLTITGCFTSPSKIRLICCDTDGRFVVFDYSLVEKFLIFIQSVWLDYADEGGWVIDFDVGLHVQMKDDVSFVLFSAVRKQCPFIVWFDPIKLQTVCQFALPRNRGDFRTKVMAIENLQPVSKNNSLAVVVAERSVSQESSSDGTFYVVQILVEEAEGQVVLCNPHLLYQIPAGQDIISVAMASVLAPAPYSFRYKLWKKGEKDCFCKQFEPDETISFALGAIRALVCRDEFDQADEMLTEVGVAALEDEPYAGFHSSEIALHRLKHTFTTGSSETLENAQVCLRKLAAGAASSNAMGLPLFMSAIDFVINSRSNLTIGSYLLGLNAVTSTIGKVLATNQNQKLQSKRLELEKRICTLEFLSQIENCEPRADFRLSTPFNTIRSPSHLYGVLIKEHKFDLAEMLYCSNLRDCLSTESIVIPILTLNADVEPQAYISLVNQVAIPNLVVNDELLSRLNSWCCKVADDLDDKDEGDLNLDAAILLLEVRLYTRN